MTGHNTVQETGIWIGDKHTLKDWGLNLLSMVIPMPEAKTEYLDIPGADGSLDLTEALGGIRYHDRQGISFTFSRLGDYTDWHLLTSRIASYLHGRKSRIVIDSDAGHFYQGRLTLDSQKSSYLLHQLVISGTFDPYKYETEGSLDDWLWDPFNFEDGVIREYKDIEVRGALDFVITGSPMPVVPTFLCSDPLQVTWKGVSYDLAAGENKVYAIRVLEGDHEMKFTGYGRVSIDYRGGIL